MIWIAFVAFYVLMGVFVSGLVLSFVDTVAKWLGVGFSYLISYMAGAACKWMRGLVAAWSGVRP